MRSAQGAFLAGWLVVGTAAAAEVRAGAWSLHAGLTLQGENGPHSESLADGTSHLVRVREEQGAEVGMRWRASRRWRLHGAFEVVSPRVVERRGLVESGRISNADGRLRTDTLALGAVYDLLQRDRAVLSVGPVIAFHRYGTATFDDGQTLSLEDGESLGAAVGLETHRKGRRWWLEVRVRYLQGDLEPSGSGVVFSGDRWDLSAHYRVDLGGRGAHP